MTAMKRTTHKERKVNVVVMLRENEITFLDRKIDKKTDELFSRSAILRLLIYRAMVHPELLDIEFEKK